MNKLNYLTGISLIIIAGLVIGGVFYFKMESQKAKGAISTEGLVLWLKMDDNLPTTNVIDSSVEGNHGTLSDVDGSPGATTAAHSAVSLHQRALTFDGTDDYVAVANDASLNLTSAFTISAWVKAISWNTSSSNMIVRKDRGSDSGYRLSQGWGSIVVETRDTYVLTGQSYFNVSLVPVNEWHHIVGVYDGAQTIIYLDGVEKDRDNCTGYTEAEGDLYIGSSNSGSYFDGSIDDVRIYNRALSAEEIALHYFLGSETRLKNAIIKNAIIR